MSCERTVPEPPRFSFYHQRRGEMIDHVLFSLPMLGSWRTVETLAFATALTAATASKSE